jgi:selenide,water dikinase
VLSRLSVKIDERVVAGLDAPDDAAVTVSEPGALNVHSVDFFRSCVSDPFVFGKIAAEHCLGDLYAMGAEPRSALALATVRLGVASVMEEELLQVMSGALEVLKDHGVVLAGGHSAEGPETVFGLAVLGSVRREALLRKGGMAVGEQLILTKPLGTGALLAAHMRRRAKGEWVEGAVASMLRSNREALRVAREHGVTGCTDVTGFGLLGHLHEMCRASQTGAEVRLEAVPLLEGVREVMAGGVFSSLHAENLRVRDDVEVVGAVQERVEYGALFDPQTSGGLLLSVPADQAEKCCRALREAGLEGAAGIGRVMGVEGAGKLIRVVR